MEMKKFNVLVRVDCQREVDNEQLHNLASDLRIIILEADQIESVELIWEVENETTGAKGTSIDFGSLLVKVAEVVGFENLIKVLTGWLSRDDDREVFIKLGDRELKVNGISKAQQQELIDWFKMQAGMQLSE